MPVLRNVEGLLGGVQELEDVRWGWGVYYAGGDELVHRLMVGGFRGVMDEAGSTDGDSAGEKGHAEGLLVGYLLEGANQVGSLEVLD